ncbi:hypothetical protein GE09DRAFT_1269016 [Coniochaeta sp. 2T2.1]|nr:hypothetical protein GE09DRAFT_1269016 [Coniochaeta sp. 2T2.1]
MVSPPADKASTQLTITGNQTMPSSQSDISASTAAVQHHPPPADKAKMASPPPADEANPLPTASGIQTMSPSHSDNFASNAVEVLATNATGGSGPQTNPGGSDETTDQQSGPELVASSGASPVEFTIRKKDDTMNKEPKYIQPSNDSIGFTNEFPDLFEPSPPSLKQRPTDSRFQVQGHMRDTVSDVLKRYGRNSSKRDQPNSFENNRPSPFKPTGKDKFMGFTGDALPVLCGYEDGDNDLPGVRPSKPAPNPPAPSQTGPSCRLVTEADILEELRNPKPAPSTGNAFSFLNEDRPFCHDDLITALEQEAAEASPFNDVCGVRTARNGPSPRQAPNDDTDPTCVALLAAIRSALAPPPVTVAEEEKVVLSLVYGTAKSLIRVTFSKLAPMAKWHATAKADAAANPDPAGEYEARDAAKALIRAIHKDWGTRGRLSAKEALAVQHMDTVLGLGQEWKAWVAGRREE